MTTVIVIIAILVIIGYLFYRNNKPVVSNEVATVENKASNDVKQVEATITSDAAAAETKVEGVLTTTEDAVEQEADKIGGEIKTDLSKI